MKPGQKVLVANAHLTTRQYAALEAMAQRYQWTKADVIRYALVRLHDQPPAWLVKRAQAQERS